MLQEHHLRTDVSIVFLVVMTLDLLYCVEWLLVFDLMIVAVVVELYRFVDVGIVAVVCTVSVLLEGF